MKNIFLYSLTGLSLLFSQSVAGQETLTVDIANKYQTIDGFGGSLAYYDGWLPAHPNRSKIYDYLFSDLGMSILRLRNTFMDEGGNNPDMDNSATIVAEGKKRSSFDIMISSWSPAGKYKSNGKPANDGTMATLATDTAGNFVYGGFADWWYQSLIEYKKKGIDAAYISIQNEPNWNPDYEGCIFMPQEQVVYDTKLDSNVKVASYAKAFTSVYDTIAENSASLSMVPKMIGPEVLGIENAWSGRPSDYTKYMDMSECYAVAHHLYTGADAANMAILANKYPDKPKMQTEYSDKDWFTLSEIIQNSLVVENVTAYLVWDMFWPGENSLIITDFPWDRSQWAYPDGFKVTTKYYMFKQFAKFIKPGWIRVNASVSGSSVKSSAFISPDSSKMSIVLINTSDNEDSVTIAPENFYIDSGKIYSTTETLNCSLTDDYTGDYTGGTVKIPGKSVSTVTLALSYSVPQNIKSNPDNQKGLMVYPNPFTTETTLDLQKFSNDAEIAIYNVNGQLIARKKTSGNDFVKIGASLEKGIYLLMITDGAKKISLSMIKQ
jgi:glucuronoarabinoxylan endo-1,4-beta-xylanase